MKSNLAKPALLLYAGALLLVSTADAQRTSLRPVKIDTIYGSVAIHVDEVDNYRVRINTGATWPVQYYWDLGFGTQSIGNNIVHKFNRPGNFRVRVWARNAASVDSSEIVVRVTSPDTVVPDVPIVAAGTQAVTANTARTGKSQRSSTRKAPADEAIEEGQAFAWVIGTHLDKASAERALQNYRAENVAGVRIFEDRSGKGARAYRVAIGNYLSLDSAVRSKPAIEKIVDRKVWLFAFSQ